MASPEKYRPTDPLKGEYKSGHFRDTDMQAVIGRILRAGVITSMMVVCTGGILYLYRHGQTIPDYRTFKGTPDFVHGTKGIINGILNLKGQAIIQTGIILLIATPVIRVIFSLISFLIEKDHLYTCITLIVLCIIVASMFSGSAG